MTIERLHQMTEAVKKHATEHYEDGGWDVVVECWTDKEIQDWLVKNGAATPEEAIDSFKDLVSIWADRQADARNSAF